jgi:D-alanyl-D-alanine carboxypeptidase
MTTSPIRSPRRRGRRIRRNLGLATIVAGTLSTSVPGAMAAQQHGDQTRLRRDADAITALGATGAQVRLITADGRNLIATSGVGDLTTRRPVSPDGYFRIASVTKTFVATLMLQLAGDGRLSLDDTVERWLPGVVSGNGNDGRTITIRRLLQHTSGIHDDYPDYTSAKDFYQHRYDTYTAEQIVARAMLHQPDFRPGKGWSYSNTGYVLLGLIIQRVTGHPWHEELRDRILRPFGLDHTFWPGTSPTLPRPHAASYQRFNPGEPLVDGHRTGRPGHQWRGRTRLHHRRSQPVLPRPARRPSPASCAAGANEEDHSRRRGVRAAHARGP